jgi:predicted nucleic acid-binding Zn ribbon protein
MSDLGTEHWKLCPKCGRMFEPYRSFQKYCSDGCRVKATSHRPTAYIKQSARKIECDHCQEQFEAVGVHRRFCSDACREAFYAKRNKPKDTRNCLICDEEFKTSHWLKRYCSEECRREAARRRVEA